MLPMRNDGVRPDAARQAVTSTAEVRPARPEDIPRIAQFVGDLAAAEAFPGTVTATESDLEAVLFGPDALARALVVHVADEPVGFALYYPTYSTVTGRRGVHLEDLFVTDPFRGQGIGELLMRHLAELAHETGGRLEWWVLRFNTDAHRFYERLGARTLSEVDVWRLADRPLDRFVIADR
jgi:GNAT superfamily N-acetyltransferase